MIFALIWVIVDIGLTLMVSGVEDK